MSFLPATSKCSLPLPSFPPRIKIDRMTPLTLCQACSYSPSTTPDARPYSRPPKRYPRGSAHPPPGDSSRAWQTWFKNCSSRWSIFGLGKDVLSWRGLCVRFLPNLFFTPFLPRTKLDALPQRTDPGRRALRSTPIFATSETLSAQRRASLTGIRLSQPCIR